MPSPTPIKESPEQSWELFKQYAQELLHKRLEQLMSLSSAAICGHHEQQLLPALEPEFLKEISAYDGRSSMALWLDKFIKRFVEARLGKIVKGRQVIDDELVRLAQTGFEPAMWELMERYSEYIDKVVKGVVWSEHKCPPSQDAVAFAQDVASEVKVRVITKLSTFKFESSFKSWLRPICENEAETARRKIQGQGPVPREYVSFDELQKEPHAFAIRNEEHIDILKRLWTKHGGKGERAQKSLKALHLRYFEGYEIEEVARRVGLTRGSLYQLNTEDYEQLRQMSIDDFGYSGRDL